MNSRRLFIATLLVLGILGMATGLVFAFTGWVTVGSDGTPDDSNRSRVIYTGTTAELQAGFIGTVIMRYNVDEGSLHNMCVAFRVRYLDTGNGARVIVKLKQHNFLSGEVTEIDSFDSNTQTPSSNWQVSPEIGGGAIYPNFADNAYFFEVQLKRTATGHNPGVSQIRLYAIPC